MKYYIFITITIVSIITNTISANAETWYVSLGLNDIEACQTANKTYAKIFGENENEAKVDITPYFVVSVASDEYSIYKEYPEHGAVILNFKKLNGQIAKIGFFKKRETCLAVQ